MPLQPQALGMALDEKLTLHSTLCRRDAGAFLQALPSGNDVVVACTQEQRLFGDLGQQTEGAVSPIRFVNIRETGGWSRDAAKASPKIAALLAAARLPDPPPVPTVTYKSTGRLLIIGPLDQAEQAFAPLDHDILLIALAAFFGSLLGALLLIVTGRARRIELAVEERTQALRPRAGEQAGRQRLPHIAIAREQQGLAAKSRGQRARPAGDRYGAHGDTALVPLRGRSGSEGKSGSIRMKTA